jgi:hypothetical protein
MVMGGAAASVNLEGGRMVDADAAVFEDTVLWRTETRTSSVRARVNSTRSHVNFDC